MVAALGLVGCATSRPGAPAANQPFRFGQDTFAYSNELVWSYQVDGATGKMVMHQRKTHPIYYQHCFVMGRSALQFYENARFAPELPKVSDATYHDSF